MLLRTERVSKSYFAADGSATTILQDISFEADSGASIAIVGPSGSGKSTLLQIIGGLDQPTSGAVWLEVGNLAAMDETALALVRNRKIGFVFQAHHLLPQCTVLENVLVPALADGSAAGPAVVARAEQLLRRVGLEHRLNHPSTKLSGGERQRVALVRALINQPRLLLADEPTGSLDQAASASIAELLLELNKEQNVTLILVTHSMDLARGMQRMFRLRNGGLEPA